MWLLELLGWGWMLLWVRFEKCIGTAMVFLNMIFVEPGFAR